MSEITTVIVTFNASKWIDECLSSLRNSIISTVIIVIDNASTDGTKKLIRQRYPQVVLLEQKSNLGFGKANNIGISEALNMGASYVFLLNQDTKIEPSCLGNLLKSYQGLNGYGVLSPVHFNYTGDKLEYYFELFANKNELFRNDFNGDKVLKAIYEVLFVNAAAWFISKETLANIGGFDPAFHHYGEDNNYCQRLNYHGLKIGIVPTSVIYHDSEKRNHIKVPLFSDSYFKMEIKKLQIEYADINRTFYFKDRMQIRWHQIKIIGRNLFSLNLYNIFGYIRKSLIFEKEFRTILKSRIKNKKLGIHYLNFKKETN